jgi:hypothetical protein
VTAGRLRRCARPSGGGFRSVRGDGDRSSEIDRALWTEKAPQTTLAWTGAQ